MSDGRVKWGKFVILRRIPQPTMEDMAKMNDIQEAELERLCAVLSELVDSGAALMAALPSDEMRAEGKY